MFVLAVSTGQTLPIVVGNLTADKEGICFIHGRKNRGFCVIKLVFLGPDLPLKGSPRNIIYNTGKDPVQAHSLYIGSIVFCEIITKTDHCSIEIIKGSTN